MFALVTYARAVAVLAPRLEEPLAKAAIGKIAQAINGLAGQDSLSDRELRALAEIVGVFSDRIGSEMIRPVRERLRKEIPTPGDASERRGRALGRAIEVMVADLSPSQRVEAARSISGQLAQNLGAWNPTAIPRTLEVLLTALDGGAPPDVLSGLPSAMAAAAVARADADSAYLLALMQVVESLATLPDESLAASFGQQLFAQLSRPNDPLQQAALVRAAIPLLERQDEHAKALIPMIASNTVLPEAWDSTADPAHEARLRRYAQDALRRAVEAPQGPARRFAAERVWRHLQQRWAEAPRPDARRNPYRQAAQARLLAMLGPSLAKDSAAFATVDLLAMLSRTSNHQSREAIARALTGLASRLPASERADSLAAAKAMLANTGSSEEARAWTIAIVALLPEDATAATAEIVQALKYPTATGAPTDILLAAARKLWPDGNEIAGRTLPDADVVDWLQGHLPRGVDTDEPTDRPAALHSATDQLEG